MQELIKRRRRAGFVGRRGELALFRENFDVPVEDERHRFIFHVHGNAGVGKTSLVRELEHAARQRQALTATLDDSVHSVPEAMAAIAAQFARQDRPLKALERMLATYRQRRHEAEAAVPEPEQPADAASPAPPSAGSMVAAQAGLVGLGLLPGVGALAGAMDPAHVAQGADRLKAVLGARFRNQEDVQLVLDPVRFLTPVLIAELDRVGADSPWIALFFDTYERTGSFLDVWLREMITTERYGTLPAHVVVTMAGQGRLDPGCWADYADLVTELPLEPFTEPESRQLLAAKGVLDEKVVQDVLRLSGGLPVLVSTLAQNPGEVSAPSATAVDRFLKWEADSVRRSVALACALPRRLDEDVFAAVTDVDAELYDWLRTLPFVSDRDGHAQYHDVVRGPMLRLQRTRSPRRWHADHERLAQTFASWAETAAEGVPEDELWEQESWRGPHMEEAYHRLCARPEEALPRMLRDGVDACDSGRATTRRWARVLAAAGDDTDSEELRTWGRDALAALEGEQGGPVRVVSLLLARAGFREQDQVAALVVRGMHHRLANDYPNAVADYERALALDPTCARAHFGQAVVRLEKDDFAGALAGLDRADSLSPDTAWILEHRGEIHRVLNHLEEAVADCDRALRLVPDRARALATRGHAKYLMDRNREALADLDRAVELDAQYWWALIRRSEVRFDLGDEAGALADLDRAEEIEPELAWVPGERGYLHFQCGRHEQALVEYDRALTLDPTYAWALGSRALALDSLGRVDEALAALGRAVELKPDYGWALVRRAEIHRRLGDRDAQFADLNQAVAVNDDPAWALAVRGDAYRCERRFEQALTDLDRAVELKPDYGWAIGTRGQTYRAMKRHPQALTDLERAALLLKDTPWVLNDREALYRELRSADGGWLLVDDADLGDAGDAASWIRHASVRTAETRLEEALAAFDRALELAPEHTWARARRAWIRGRLGDQQGHFEELDRLVAANPYSGWAFGRRALALQSAGLTRRSMADLDRSLALGYSPSWVEGRRAVGLLNLDRPEEAMAVLDALPPGARDDELRLIAETSRRLGRFEEAREAALRLRTFDAEDGLFHLTMAESRMRGTEAVADLWRECALAHTVADPEAPTAEELVDLVVMACALGEWSEAEHRLERLLAQRPEWGDVTDLVDLLAELDDCPGAARQRYAPLLARLAVARSGLAGADGQ
ncbi:tetratricopeptide (TPR) repeat protein [Streptomyces sp. SLBN-118]|nr:tetratricopeptide (TPR) repeat protein [Streptomyces sp. SLBN-118]